jgi:hypothetical protein
MTTKELLKECENRTAFSLAWAILWRQWVLMMGVYAVILVAALFVAIVGGV